MSFEELFREGDGRDEHARASLPYAVRVPERERRAALAQMLEDAGFACVVRENGFPVLYVNFTLRRYGRNIRPCASASINPGLMTEAEFRNLFRRYQEDEAFRARLSDHFLESLERRRRGILKDIERDARESGGRDTAFQQCCRKRLAELEQNYLAHAQANAAE